MATEVTIVCERCGFKHRLLRMIEHPELIRIVCHRCELPIEADVTQDRMTQGKLLAQAQVPKPPGG